MSGLDCALTRTRRERPLESTASHAEAPLIATARVRWHLAHAKACVSRVASGMTSISGAGTVDGILLTGILALYLA